MGEPRTGHGTVVGTPWEAKVEFAAHAVKTHTGATVQSRIETSTGSGSNMLWESRKVGVFLTVGAV